MKNVRFSQMSPEDRKKYTDKLLGILKKIKEICDENNIHWFVAYGSCIGAVRHKGMIPWDDDIDICMPRPDYDRFVEICRKTDLGNHELAVINEFPEYYEFIIRLFDKNSSVLFDDWHTLVSGIFIDIFPLDGAADGNIKDNHKKFVFWQQVSRFSHMRFPRSKRMEILKAGGYRGYIAILLVMVFRKPLQKISVKKIDKIVRKYSYENSEYVGFYNEITNLKSFVPKEWISETIMVPFENIEVPIPKHYHEYLTRIYGDYMTPPPENKRDDRHVFAFIDMDKRLTLKQIRKILAEE